MMKNETKHCKPIEAGELISTSGMHNDATKETLELQNLITRKEVAQSLKVSVQTVINYTNCGLLTSYKVGRRVLYDKTEVLAAIRAGSVKHCQHDSSEIYNSKK